MARRRGKYQTHTEGDIKRALVALLKRKSLQDITISELAREAQVSRSTFYDHYGNPADVYDALLDDVSEDLSPLMSQVTCTDGFKSTGRPFCELVRSARDIGAVVDEPRFMDSFFSRRGAPQAHDLFDILVSAGYDEHQAQAVCSFQLAGCFSAARGSSVTDAEWASIRPVIDRFILGGIAACLAAKTDSGSI